MQERVCIWSVRKTLTLLNWRPSRSPTTVMSANGDLQTREEATGNVKKLDFFVKVMLLEETPAVLSLVKLCEDHGYTYHWISGQKPHLIRNGKRMDCNISNYVPCVAPGLLASSFQLHLHLLLHHLHQRIPCLMSTDSPKSSTRKKWKYESGVTEKPAAQTFRNQKLKKNEEREEEQRDISHELPDWLQEFREYLVDERGPLEPCGNPCD